MTNDRHDQRAKALLQTEDLLPPGTFTPQNPKLEEVLTPTVNTNEQAAKDLELLAQIVCDRISPHLNSQMERRGFHQSNRIFSHQTIATDKIFSKSEQAADVLERLTQEIEQLLHHRLIYERERWGRSGGCLPW